VNVDEQDQWMPSIEAGRYLQLSASTLCALARSHKIQSRKGRRSTRGRARRAIHSRRARRRKLWFRKSQLDNFLRAHILFGPDGKDTQLSAALRSRKILLVHKYEPGELLTKLDAAFVLGRSIRGVEYLMENQRLKPLGLNLGHRTVVFKRSTVVRLQRELNPRGKKIGTTKASQRSEREFRKILFDYLCGNRAA
jgi:hypothetical protein